MTLVSGQDSNRSSVSYAFEQSLGVLPGTPIWVPMEPNSEADFGGDIKTMSRNPISADRQSIKGSVVDVESGVTIEQDFTLSNQEALLTAYMCAAERARVAAATLTTTTSGTTINGTGMGGFAANDLVLLAQSGIGADGLYLVVSATATTVVVASIVNGTLSASATLCKVGIQCASGDINVTTAGNFAQYTSTATNFTTRLNLAPGQSVYVGGDSAALQFATLGNNGAKRVLAVTATSLLVDKSQLAMTNETGTAKTVQIFTTACLKNEQGALLIEKFVQLERTLGAPDDALLAQVQSEYVVGCVASEYTFDAKPATKITSTMKFMGKDVEQRTGATGVKTGTRATLPQVNAVNTSSDPRRFRVARVDLVNEAAAPLWQLTEDFSFTIKNNFERNLALGTIGAARFSLGEFDVTGSMTPYLTDISILQAARQNFDVTADLFVASSNNTGFAIDFPLMTLSKARAVVAQDKPIMVPCDFEAHRGAKVNAALDHTLMWTWFDYLPTLAQTQP